MLELEEFRSYRQLQLPLTASGLRLIGDNASGKSTLLEAIAMLATTRSLRTSSEREVINWHSGEDLGVPPFARLRGVVQRSDRSYEVEIGIQVDPNRPTHVRKQIRVNGRPTRAMDAVGTLKAVLFSPEDIGLVSGSPSGRRRYLDLTISQLDPFYLRSLARFGRVLEQRNSLLRSLAASGMPAQARSAGEQLGFWDAELIAHGSAVIARRSLAVDQLGRLAAARFQELAGRDDLIIRYEPTVPVVNSPQAQVPTIETIQPVVARNYEARLREARTDEFRRGTTLVGPHRDDLIVRLGDIDVSLYGSRGQQRLAVLALKIAETTLMADVAGEPPVLLLDDVLSELDAGHRSWVLKTASGVGTQIIVTATGAELLQQQGIDHIPAIRVANGRFETLQISS